MVHALHLPVVMRLGWMVVVVLACACGPSDDEFGASNEVQYGRCESGVDDPVCRGLDCATSVAGREQLTILLEVVESRGWADVFTPTAVIHHEDAETVRIEYFLQIDWFRAPGYVTIDLEGTRLQQQHQYEAQLDTWRVPDAVVDTAEIAAAIEGCDPELEIDPCYSFASDFIVRVGHSQDDTCPTVTSYASVDAVTGELLDCRVDEPTACEDSG